MPVMSDLDQGRPKVVIIGALPEGIICSCCAELSSICAVHALSKGNYAAVSADVEAEHSWTAMRVAICAAEDAKAACQLALR